MHCFRLFFRSKAVHYFICSLSNSFCAVTFVNNNAAYKINRNKHENTLRVLFSDIFSYITTESGFTHQIRTDCRRSSTENGQTAAGKPQLETAAREPVFPRFATLHSEKQIRYCVYFRFRGFFDCTYLDISIFRAFRLYEKNQKYTRGLRTSGLRGRFKALPEVILQKIPAAHVETGFACKTPA